MAEQMSTTGGQRPAWEVTSVEDWPGPTSLGGSNRMKRVHYRMANGDESFVDVAYKDGWVGQANILIDQAVMDHIDALNLKASQY